MAEYDQELDACGLNCPLPILRAKKSLSSMETGQVLHVVATDPGAIKDFEAFWKQTHGFKRRKRQILFSYTESISNKLH